MGLLVDVHPPLIITLTLTLAINLTLTLALAAPVLAEQMIGQHLIIMTDSVTVRVRARFAFVVWVSGLQSTLMQGYRVH